MTAAPRFSVVMATYNGARYLPEQLASIAAQTAPPAELVVADDGSTDETGRILRDFARDAPFPVRLLEPVGWLGPTGAFARAMGEATGDVVAFCDQDDVWAPEKLAALGGVFADLDVALAVCDARLVDASLQPIGRTLWQHIGFSPANRRLLDQPERTLLGKTIAFGMTMSVVNSAKMKQYAFPIPPRFGHDLWLSLIAASLGKTAILDAALVDYRQHEGQVGGAKPGSGLMGRLRPGNPSLAPDAAALRTTVSRLDAIADVDRGADWAGVRAHVSGLAAHLGAREALVSTRMSLPRRFASIAREGALGHYHLYSNGWKSIVRDVIWGPGH